MEPEAALARHLRPVHGGVPPAAAVGAYRSRCRADDPSAASRRMRLGLRRAALCPV
jgi:hypothetical protein